jgi:chloramphenicol 3-O phosphotransferase
VTIAVLVNGPSSSGKSTLCRALLLQLTELADGDPDLAFGGVAFDDMVPLIAESLYPISFVQLQGNDVGHLLSRTPHDGRAGWEYVDQSDAEGVHGGSPRVRLELHPTVRRLLHGVHLGWAAHLTLGTNLIIDHFLQEQDWADECLAALHDSGASVISVGVFCSLDELERRESSRADGGVEGRPLGLARRSDELCHSTGVEYDVTVSTSEQTTDESVAAILAALQSAGHLPTGRDGVIPPRNAAPPTHPPSG